MDKTDAGKRVELVATTDEFTDLEPGERGTILFRDDAGTIHVDWDSGSTLGLVPEDDTWVEVEMGPCPLCEQPVEIKVMSFESSQRSIGTRYYAHHRLGGSTCQASGWTVPPDDPREGS